MSLLPEFNQHFIDLWHIEVGRELARGKEPNAMQILRDLLNPDRNPLTFEEVKAWFDRMAEKAGDFQYHGEIVNELGFPCFHYSILCYQGNLHGYREFSIYINEWGFSYSSRTYEFAIFNLLLEECGRHHYNLLSIMRLSPLELFCQMKGYIEF